MVKENVWYFIIIVPRVKEKSNKYIGSYTCSSSLGKQKYIITNTGKQKKIHPKITQNCDEFGFQLTE